MTVSAPQRLASREEWLRARKIGSSDAAAVLGVSVYPAGSPYRSTAFDVWEEKVGLAPAERHADQVHARRGQRLEPRLLRTFEALIGERVERPQGFTLYRREDWATATPDGLRPRRRRVVETKTDRQRERWGPACRIERWEADTARIVRPDHFLQTQHLLWVTGYEACDLVVLLPPDPDGDDPFTPELRVYDVARDDELLARMVPRLRSFWRDHVLTRTPPPLDDSDAAERYLARLQRGETRRAAPYEEQLAAYYLASAGLEKAAKEQKRAAARGLLQLSGSASRLELASGGHVTIVQRNAAAQLDEGALLADHPELSNVLERYRRPGNVYAYPVVRGA